MEEASAREETSSREEVKAKVWNFSRPTGEAESGAKKVKSALHPQATPLESLKIVSTGEKQTDRTLPM